MPRGCPVGKEEARRPQEDDSPEGLGVGLEDLPAPCPALGEREAFRAQILTPLCL